MNMKIELPKLHKVTRETGERYYVTPAGNKYPSVTTVLSEPKKKQLKKWREWVGIEEADRIKGLAAARGSRFHTLCEHYLNKEHYNNDIGAIFDQFKPYLNRISKIICMEQHLYSDDLRVAGQVDCVGEFDNFPAIIDFKTSSKIKVRSNIWDYFMQAAAYSHMFKERTGIDIPTIIILISCGTPDGTCQIYIDKRDNWLDGFKQYRQQYDDTLIVA
jgi:genome maintenance exonuclease 1